MTDTAAPPARKARALRVLPDLPMVLWIVVLALALGLSSGMAAGDIVSEFNAGFGRALGEFALILLPSFILAAALARKNLGSEAAGRTAVIASPAAGAGMICPDTAYAALSPAAGPRGLDLAFGTYAGFKLLYPAGPLIVATGLGVAGSQGAAPLLLLLCGIGLTLPVWAAGVTWGRLTMPQSARTPVTQAGPARPALLKPFAPFLLMTGLLVAGGLIGPTGNGVLDFLLLPKGALMVAALLALAQTPADARRACLDSAVRRTGSLLFIIGAASAFGAILTGLVRLDGLIPEGRGMLTLIALFLLTTLFKLSQGSSMATFAAVAPVAAPIVMASGVNDTAAVFAICLGSFIAILPNDSFYWLVRQDALARFGSDGRAIWVLAGGAVVQALVGMVVLLGAIALIV
ncbi:MAG: permease [Pseudomonadota bacterium]